MGSIFVFPFWSMNARLVKKHEKTMRQDTGKKRRKYFTLESSGELKKLRDHY